MSGPIVRKYGFPNFDKIFGERPLEHGVDDLEPSKTDADQPSPAKSKKKSTAKPKKTEPKKG